MLAYMLIIKNGQAIDNSLTITIDIDGWTDGRTNRWTDRRTM